MDKVKIVILLLLSFWAFQTKAQNLPADVLTVKDGELIFKIDLRWDSALQQQLIDVYDLDSALVAGVFNGQKSFDVDGEKWQARKKGRNHVMLQKPLQRKPSLGEIFLKMIIHNPGTADLPGYVNGPVPFGFNQFARQSVTFSEGNTVQFTLFGHDDANEVYLAGSFNNWQTHELKLKKYQEGWKTTLELEPGKYYYKFIVDGRWMPDPHNLLKESDGVNDFNSILFVPNHTFRLDNYQSAENVYLTGSFNSWKDEDAPLHKTSEGWELDAYVDYGRHTYKFIVDDAWILDPANPNKSENEYGTGNSVLNIGESYQFTLKGYPGAQNVFLAGNFNNWNPNDIRMKRADSLWEAVYYLGPGNYEYKFIVDGEWILDPENPKITHSGEISNSLLVYKPNHTFVLDDFEDAKEVIVTGSFNDWNPNGYHMLWRNNHWELDLHLPDGKIIYKFVVDGDWIPDPANPVYETNEHGTYNSILWIK